jgi:hypothetical protein
MTGKERYTQKVKVNQYDELEQNKAQILNIISRIQKQAIHSVMFWTENKINPSSKDTPYILYGAEEYKQLTLDYLNMLYETMCNDQKNL